MTTRDQPAILWVMLDVDPADADELYRWYDEEHIPIRLDLPGWVRTRRFLHADGRDLASSLGIELEPGRAHLTIYDVESLDAFTTPDYAAQYGVQTPWSAKVVPTQQRVMRSYYREADDRQLASSSHEATAALICMFDVTASDAAVGDWFDDAFGRATGPLTGLLRVRRYELAEVPWPGAKWMQPEVGRRHLIVHELDDIARLESDSLLDLMRRSLSPDGPLAAERPLAGGYTLVADRRGPTGWFAQARRESRER